MSGDRSARRRPRGAGGPPNVGPAPCGGGKTDVRPGAKAVGLPNVGPPLWGGDRRSTGAKAVGLPNVGPPLWRGEDRRSTGREGRGTAERRSCPLWRGEDRRSAHRDQRDRRHPRSFPRCVSKRSEAPRARRGDRPQSLRDCQLNPRTASTVPRTPHARTTARLPALSASDSPVTSAAESPSMMWREGEDLGDVAQELGGGVDVVEHAGDEDDRQEDDVRVGRGRIEVRDHVGEGDAQRRERRHAGEREDGQLEPVLGPADAEEQPSRQRPRSRPARTRWTPRWRPRPRGRRSAASACRGCA